MRGSLFVSYSSRDTAFVRRLVNDLRAAGATVWFDESAIRPGDSVIGRISVALAEVEWVLVVLSPDAVASRWVQKEIELAVTHEVDGRGVVVVPIFHRDCQIPRLLAEKRFVDFRDPARYAEGLRELTLFLGSSAGERASLPANDLHHRVQAVLTAVQMLSRSILSTDRGARNVKGFMKDMRRLDALVWHARVLSRQTVLARNLEKDFSGVARRPVDVAALARHVAAMFNVWTAGYEIRFFVTTRPRRIVVRADPFLLETALYHLLDNALRYSFPGKVDVEVVRWKAEMQLRVTNRGIAVTPSDAAKIFDRGYRGEDARLVTAEGSGLGLYLTRLAMAAQEGTVAYSASATPGENVFTLSLPV